MYIYRWGERARERVQTRVSKFFWVTHSHFQGYYYYLFIYLISLLRFRVAINSHAKAAQALLCPQHSQPSQASLAQPFPPVSVGDVCFLQIIVHSFRHLPQLPLPYICTFCANGSFFDCCCCCCFRCFYFCCAP